MGRSIAIFNQKGGVGKTTTNINLAACLAIKGKKILVLDLDPQNTTSGLGIPKKSLKITSYELLINDGMDPRESDSQDRGSEPGYPSRQRRSGCGGKSNSCSSRTGKETQEGAR